MKSARESLHQRSRRGLRDGSRSFHLPPLAAGPAPCRCGTAARPSLPAGLSSMSPVPGFSPRWHRAVARRRWLGVVAGREARGPLAPSPASPGSASHSGKPQPKILRGRGIYQRGQGKQLGLPLAAADRQRQINCRRAGRLPPPCPAPPDVCRRLCPISISRRVKKRAGCLAYRLPPSFPIRPTGGHPAAPSASCPVPTWPRHGFLTGKPVTMWLARVFPHLRAGELTAAPVWVEVLSKGKAANEGLSLKPFPVEQRQPAGSSRPRTPREVNNWLFRRKSS